MATLDDFKNKWAQSQLATSTPTSYDSIAFEKLVKSRVNVHTRSTMQYFWASFTLQIVVYALLTHVIVRYWPDASMLLLAFCGIILFVPFTIVLMRKFKRMATVKPIASADTRNSLQDFVGRHLALLSDFYRFKKRYELMLIPLSAVIGIILTFKLYVPGGVAQHPTGAIITFVITLLSCAQAIRAENKKSFKEPMHRLRDILDEFSRDV